MKTTRYKFRISYDGTHFAGFQVQPNQRTVQGDIEKALKMISKGQFIRIHGAGRTDAGVHALGQIIHFDYPQRLPADAMQRALNTLTTDEIAFWEPEIVSEDFHSQYSAKAKTYQYRVNNSKIENPFTRLYALHHPYPMKMDRIQKALSYFVGEHDFTSFSSTHSNAESKVRTIYEASCRYEEATQEFIFTFRGNGFLYNQIRVMMGTLLQVADGRRPAEDIPDILEAKYRKKAGPTAASRGLCMMEVFYENNEEQNVKNT